MWKVVGALVAGLLALWLVITVVAWAIKGLFWLAVVGTVVVLAVAAIGWGRRKARELR